MDHLKDIEKYEFHPSIKAALLKVFGLYKNAKLLNCYIVGIVRVLAGDAIQRPWIIR